MRSVTLASAAFCAALGFGVTACEEPPAPAPTKPVSTGAASVAQAPTASAAAPAALTDEQKLAKIKDCMAAMDGEPEKFTQSCFAENIQFDSVDALPPEKMSSRAEVAAHFKEMRTAFTDTHHEVGPVLVNGDQVVFLMVVHGKNTGAMHGMPATNKEVGFPIAVSGKLGADGMWTEAHGYQDQGTMMAQLGMAPKEAPPARAAVEKGSWWTETTYVVAKNDQTEKDNLAVYDKSQEAFNAHKVDDVMAQYSDDALFRYVGGAKDEKGKDAFKKGLEGYYKFSSDVKSTIDWKFAAGDYVVAAMTGTGTNDGTMPEMGMTKPTGKTFTSHGLELVKLEGGKIKEHWIFENGFATAVQLGLAPDPSTMAQGAASAAPSAETTPAKAPEAK